VAKVEESGVENQPVPRHRYQVAEEGGIVNGAHDPRELAGCLDPQTTAVNQETEKKRNERRGGMEDEVEQVNSRH
jgi:hypothetical protein